jgi:hypothetical protein
MASKFKVCDHVTWNSEAGHVSGRIVKVHRENVNYKGYVHHASKEDPQYERQDGSYRRLAQDSSAEAPSPVINLYNP